jgi:hypothetical protein
MIKTDQELQIAYTQKGLHDRQKDKTQKAKTIQLRSCQRRDF